MIQISNARKAKKYIVNEVEMQGSRRWLTSKFGVALGRARPFIIITSLLFLS